MNIKLKSDINIQNIKCLQAVLASCTKLRELVISCIYPTLIDTIINELLSLCQSSHSLECLEIDAYPCLLTITKVKHNSHSQYAIVKKLHFREISNCLSLHKCRSLSELIIDNTNRNKIDIGLVYQSCPALTLITMYRTKISHQSLQYSHSKLQTIEIREDFNIQSSTVLNTNHDMQNKAQLPSLQSLTIDGEIDGDSWNTVLAMSEFKLKRLTVTDKASLDVIMESLLYHSNFSELEYVFSKGVCYNRLKELNEVALREGGRNIKFENRYYRK